MIGIVAGSGIDLFPLLHRVIWERPFSDFPGLAASTVAGHASRFVMGVACLPCGEEHSILLQLGRRHGYEGLDYLDTVRSVDVLHSLGVTQLLLTSAAGGLDSGLKVGDIVSASAVHAWPYRRFDLPERLTPDFVLPGADATGAHAFLHGPCYETPAEIRALQLLGLSTVGMSTAPELCRCHQLGLRAGALSIVTNKCGVPHTLTHEEVIHAAHDASQRLRTLLLETRFLF